MALFPGTTTRTERRLEEMAYRLENDARELGIDGVSFESRTRAHNAATDLVPINDKSWPCTFGAWTRLTASAP